jgi:hypothetical protein
MRPDEHSVVHQNSSVNKETHQIISGMMIMTKDRSRITPISVRLEPGWKRVLERLAKEDRRSASAWAEKVLIDHMKAQGFVPEEDQGEGEK